jgi:hypothetical protein
VRAAYAEHGIAPECAGVLRRHNSTPNQRCRHGVHWMLLLRSCTHVLQSSPVKCP